MLARQGPPGPWAGQAQWRILETEFGAGENFLAAWQAWQADPQRPKLLHFASLCRQPPTGTELGDTASESAPFAKALRAQWWGMVPGVHRLVFEGGRVLLTLSIGAAADAAQQDFAADCLLLRKTDQPVDRPELNALARCCRVGATIFTDDGTPALRSLLRQCGFVMAPSLDDTPSGRGMFQPAWPLRRPSNNTEVRPSRAVVIGAGLAGAAAAASLARRGWQVEVLDAAAEPASGASALPAGLLAPHTSPDDNLLSRLTRSGVRITLQQAAALLRAGRDWQPSGVREQRSGEPRSLPPLGPGQGDWQHANAANASSIWHAAGGWIKPSALVRAWLDHPAIHWRGLSTADHLQRVGDDWQVMDAAGRPLAQAPLVVVAAAYESAALLQGRIDLHPVRGQVTWAPVPEGITLPDSPVNGNGHFLPNIPLDAGKAWLTGSTYGRGDTSTDLRTIDDAQNLDRLRALLPDVAAQLTPSFRTQSVHSWAGVRCTASDRRPIVGELEPGLWVSTAMGSRGLTFAALCAELMAARLHAEPLPLERRLAQALEPGRLARRAS